MNRPIKFRAWDTISNSMVSWKELLKEDLAHLLSNTKSLNIKWMQFTGLTDKNGKEIYEGDVVKYKWLDGFDCDDREEVIKRGIERIGVVEYRKGEFWPREYYNSCEDGYYSTRYADFEVIGNIYENPELIKQ